LIIHLDTNVASRLIRKRNPSYRQALADAIGQGDRIYMSIIVYYELIFGAENGDQTIEQTERTENLARSISGVLDFQKEDAIEAAKLRAYLASIRQHIGTYDVLIAAQALRHGARIATGNLDEFQRVPNLEIVDWPR
jgi:tRNA(fMet)-specific endonuclease VapC